MRYRTMLTGRLVLNFVVASAVATCIFLTSCAKTNCPKLYDSWKRCEEELQKCNELADDLYQNVG